MDAFSLLKYWRAAGAGAGDTTTTSSSAATTILTAATPSSSSSDSGNDDGPFFDLEFTVPDNNDDDDDESSDFDSDSDDQIGSPENVVGEVDESDEPEVILSSSAAVVAGVSEETAPKFPVASILKSASKFRVQMRRFNKKPKSFSREKEKPEEEERKSSSSSSKLLTVKLKVEEAVPLVSVLFSSRNSSETPKGNARKPVTGEATGTEHNVSEVGEDDRKFAKELMNKYLKKVKPLMSKRFGDKSPPENTEKRTSAAPTPEKQGKQGNNIQAGLRVVCKHLGKSRSASASAPPEHETPSSSRRDDSLMQQQDGIQSAIMHCKRSFNASRDSGSSTVLSRSVR